MCFKQGGEVRIWELGKPKPDLRQVLPPLHASTKGFWPCQQPSPQGQLSHRADLATKEGSLSLSLVLAAALKSTTLTSFFRPASSPSYNVKR